MNKYGFYLLCLYLLLPAGMFAQNTMQLVNADNMLSIKEKQILEIAIQYQSEFFNQIFPETSIDISGIKFVIATSLVEFVNMQVKVTNSAHINVSGFFSPSDSTLVVFKDGKAPSNVFLSVCYHELSHAFLSIHAGAKHIPPWFNEGLPVYLEQMTFDKKKILPRIDKYKINRVKTLIELKDINLSEFVQWNYQKFSTESFSQEGYGYSVGYCMLLFLMQHDKHNAYEIFSNLIGTHSTIDVFDRYYTGGFTCFEKEFMEYFSK